MKLRLMVRREGATNVVEVHGELVEAGLDEFQRLCKVDGKFVVDISNVRRVDSAATARLREMSVSNIRLVGAPRFIQMLIAGDEA